MSGKTKAGVGTTTSPSPSYPPPYTIPPPALLSSTSFSPSSSLTLPRPFPSVATREDGGAVAGSGRGNTADKVQSALHLFASLKENSAAFPSEAMGRGGSSGGLGNSTRNGTGTLWNPTPSSSSAGGKEAPQGNGGDGMGWGGAGGGGSSGWMHRSYPPPPMKEAEKSGAAVERGRFSSTTTTPQGWTGGERRRPSEKRGADATVPCSPLALLAMKEADDAMAVYDGGAIRTVGMPPRTESSGGRREEKPGPHHHPPRKKGEAPKATRTPQTEAEEGGVAKGAPWIRSLKEPRRWPTTTTTPTHIEGAALSSTTGGGATTTAPPSGGGGDPATALLPLSSSAMLEYFGANSEAQLKAMSSRELIRKLAVSEAILRRLHEKNKALGRELEEAQKMAGMKGKGMVKAEEEEEEEEEGGTWERRKKKPSQRGEEDRVERDPRSTTTTTTRHLEQQLAEREKEVEALQRRLVTLHAQHEMSLQGKENELQVGKEKQMRLMALLSELEGKVQGLSFTTVGGGGGGVAPPWSTTTGGGGDAAHRLRQRGTTESDVSLYLNSLSRAGVEGQSPLRASKGETHASHDDDNDAEEDDDDDDDNGDASLLARVHRLEVEKELLSSHLFQAEKQNRLLEDKLQKSVAALSQKSATATGDGGDGGGGDATSTSKRGERASKSSSSPSAEKPRGAAHASRLPTGGRLSFTETDSSVGEEPHPSDSYREGRSETFSGYTSVLQDEITNLRYRLQRKKVEARKLELIQVKALLDSPSTPMSRINEDVKQLFRLMKEKMMSDGIHHEAERVRMNEVMYALEKERSSSGY